MNCFIYKISCGKHSYIGSSCDLKRRKTRHYSKLRNNNHINKFMQSVFNKYGEDSFIFEVIENCEQKELINKEQHYLDIMIPDLNFNLIAGPSFRIGYKMTEEEKIHLSQKRKSLNLTTSKETKHRIRENLKEQNLNGKETNIVYNTGEIKTFKSVKDCADYLGKRRESIYSYAKKEPSKSRNFKIIINEK